MSNRPNAKKNQHDLLNTSSESSERQVSADVAVEAVVFDLIGARSADIGVISSAVVKVRQLLCEKGKVEVPTINFNCSHGCDGT